VAHRSKFTGIPQHGPGSGGMRAARWTVLVLAVLLYPLLTGFGDSPEGRNRRGNKLYGEQEYDEALTEYRNAQVLAPELRELFLNAGDALFRKGELEGAITEFERAAAAGDSLVASSASYNAGNAYLGTGQIEAAIEAYKAALRQSPGDEDAKHNLELARLMLEQQQQQDQDQQDQEKQDQQNQDQQDQEKQDQQNQDQQDQDQQNQDQQDQEQQDQQQQEQDQQDQQDQDQQDQQQQEQQEQQQQEQRETAMSEEDAARLLDAIEQEERELQAELRAAKAKKREKVDKDW
jgi:Ca-activated chloride channel family protein